MKTPQLSDVVWTDGKILRYVRDPSGLVVEFEDYTKTKWELRFTGEELELYERDAVGFDGCRAKIERDGPRSKLTLFEEDTVFSIKFDACSVKRIE